MGVYTVCIQNILGDQNEANISGLSATSKWLSTDGLGSEPQRVEGKIGSVLGRFAKCLKIFPKIIVRSIATLSSVRHLW